MSGTVNMVADRSGAAAGQTVAWTTSNAAIASVDAASGVVTGVSNGTVAVTATTTGGFSGSATVKVGDGAGGTASVTIASITKNGLDTPVITSAVAQQIDVTLNIDAAGQSLSKVELVVTDSATGVATVCATQTISAASLAAKAEGVSASVAGVSESVAAASTVTLSCNTAAVAANGAVSFTNGPKSISARIYNGAGTLINTAANSVNVNFANVSGFVLSVKNTPTTPAALRPATGQAVGEDDLLWTQGDLEITLTGANFTPGQSANFNKVTSGPITGPSGPIALTYERKDGTQSFVATIDAEDFAVAGVYTIPTAVASTTEGGTLGPIAVTPQNGNNLVRMDNSAPLPAGAGEFAAELLLPTALFVNNSFVFESKNERLFDPTAVADAGVGNAAVKFFYGDFADVGDIDFTDPSDIDFSDLTEITGAEDLEEGLGADRYGLVAVTYDALGNYIAQPLDQGFGVDRVAPTGFAYSSTTPANNTGFSAPPTVGFDASKNADDNSGFYSMLYKFSVERVAADGKTSCLSSGTAKAGACAAVVDTTSGYTFTPGLTAQGYYTFTGMLADKAGNTTDASTRFFLFDTEAPTFEGGIAMPATIEGGSSVTFTKTIKDKLDLDVATLGLVFPGFGKSFRADMKDLGSFGLPLEKSATETFTVSSFIRSMQLVGAGDAPVAPTANKASAIRFWAADAAGLTATDVANIPATTTISGAVTDFTESGIASFALDLTAKKVNNDAKATKGLTTDLVAVVEAADLTVAKAFDKVVFWYLDTVSDQWVSIGEASVGVVTDAGNVRTFTYTLKDWDPPAELGTAADPGKVVRILAVGMTGNDGLAAVQDATSITLVVQPPPAP